MGSTGGGTSTSTSTPNLDPRVSAALFGNIGTADAITGGVLPSQNKDGDWVNADGTPYQAPDSLTAGFTPDQLAAFDQIRGIAGSALTPGQLGAGTYSGLSNFQTGNVGSSNIAPGYLGATTVANVDPMQAGQVGQVGDVTGATVGGNDIQALANPYMSQVVDPVKAYFDQQSDRAAQASQANARATGALRGSNRDIGEALARGEVATAAGNALSPLYADAFKTSASLAAGNADRTQQAGLANQNKDLTTATTQAGLDSTAGLANLGVRSGQATQNASLAQQTGLANQDTNLRAQSANQSSGLAAGIANQNAGINAAGVRAAGAAGLASAATGARNSQVQGTALLSAAGDQQQALDQSQIDSIIKALQVRLAATGAAVPGTTGTTTTGTTPGGGLGSILGGLGGLAGGLGALGGSAGLAGLGPALAAI